MAQTNLSEETLKKVCKEALAEVLSEQRELLHDVFVEAFEDFTLSEAIREGRKTESCSREEVVSILRGNE